MISIIISTYRSEYLDIAQKSIDSKIGVPYEIIAVDNSNGRKGLCEVYNEGTKKAKFPYVCYAHEDIQIITPNWGQKIVDIFFQNPALGLLGIAGGTYKSYAPASWGLVEEARSVNIIQHYKFDNRPIYNHYENPKQQKLTKVVCIDGVWMCTKKVIAQEIQFDQQLFTSFHCYDLDFSLSVFQKYDVAVTFEILMEHFSEGRSDKNWVIETLKLHKKWRAKLPLSLEALPERCLKKAEKKAIEQMLTLMFEYKFSLQEILGMLYSNSKNPHVDNSELRSMKLSVVKKFIKQTLVKYSVVQS